MIKQFTVFLLYVQFFISGAFAQTVTGDLENYIHQFINGLPGSSGDDYRVPTSLELNTWAGLISHLLKDELPEARQKADQLNYQIVEYEDNGTLPHSSYYLIEEKSERQNYWGTYILNRNPLRSQVVIQSPHPIHDSNTGKQGVFCFKRLGALAFFISGTHRCNNSNLSSCSGTTTACGTTSPYGVSDNAHNIMSVFQKTTEVLKNELDNTVFIQFHGFAMQETDPYVIMSNGTRITPEPDYISTLSNELFKIDNTLTFKIPHLDLSWKRLIAFTNVQGRYINNGISPCTMNAIECSGRFIHIEQEKKKLRADFIGWLKMYEALANTFPETTVSSRGRISAKNSVAFIYPNPTDGLLNIRAAGQFDISVFNSVGTCVFESTSHNDIARIDMNNQVPGLYIVRIIRRGEASTKRIILR